jgi:hypothetical protein
VQGGQSLAHLFVVRWGVALVLLYDAAAGWSGSGALGFPVGSEGHQVRFGVRGWRVVLSGRWGVVGCVVGRVCGRLVLLWLYGVAGMWVFDRSVVLWVCGSSIMWICGTGVEFVACLVSSKWVWGSGLGVVGSVVGAGCTGVFVGSLVGVLYLSVLGSLDIGGIFDGGVVVVVGIMGRVVYGMVGGVFCVR